MPFPISNVQLSDIELRVYRLLEDVNSIDFITSNIAATPTGGSIQFTVNDVSQWPVGSRMEVDFELFQILASVANSGTAGPGTVTANRAFESSYAAAHTSGTFARRDPRFLHETIWEGVNVALNDWCSFYFPKLQWDITTAGSFQPTIWIYAAPSDALAVRRVAWLLPGFNRYMDVDHSDLNTYDTSVVSTGLGFEVYERIGMPGRAIHVLYEKRWPNLVNETDVLDATFPAEGDDLIAIGAVLYVVGVRMTPRWRLDEAMFYREQATPLPSNFNMQWLNDLEKRWYDRATQIRAKRLDRVPQKVWVGQTGI